MLPGNAAGTSGFSSASVAWFPAAATTRSPASPAGLHGLAEGGIDVLAERGPAQRDVHHVGPVVHRVRKGGDDVSVGATVIAHPDRHQPHTRGHTGHTLAVDRRSHHTAHHRPVVPEIVGALVAVSEVPPMDVVCEAIAVVVHPVARHLARVVPEPRRQLRMLQISPRVEDGDDDARTSPGHLPCGGSSHLCQTPLLVLQRFLLWEQDRVGVEGDAGRRRPVGLGAGSDPKQRPPQPERFDTPPGGRSGVIGLVARDQELALHRLHVVVWGGGAAAAVPGKSVAASRMATSRRIIV